MLTTAKKTKLSNLCARLIKWRPRFIDESGIREDVTGTARTHAEVARAFGQAANTIKQSWAAEGMPGKQGQYPLADILIWRLRYLDAVDARRQAPKDLSDAELERQTGEEELRKLKLQNDKLEREEQIAAGKVIDREQTTTGLRTLMAVTAERLMKLPSKWEPLFPLERAAEWTGIQRLDIRRELSALSEASARDVLKQGQALSDL